MVARIGRLTNNASQSVLDNVVFRVDWYFPGNILK